MKSFFKYLSCLTFISVFLAIILYILVLFFFHDYHKRSKVDVVNSTADVVFFGSSRCVNAVVPSVFDSIIGTNSYNMGWAASGPREMYAAVKLYLKKNSPPKFVFLQLDLKHDLSLPSELARQSLLKYYFTGEVDDYFNDSIKRQMLVPLLPNILYRDFGWREVIKTLFRNSDATFTLSGYAPVFGELDSTEFTENIGELKFLANQQNIWISRSIELLQKSGVEVFLFTAPYFRFTQAELFERLEMYNLPYFNLSNSILKQEYFIDRSHVNNEGAYLFTDSLAKSFKEFIDCRN